MLVIQHKRVYFLGSPWGLTRAGEPLVSADGIDGARFTRIGTSRERDL